MNNIPFQNHSKTITGTIPFGKATALSSNYFQDTFLNPVNEMLGIDSTTFQTGDPTVDSFLSKQSDNAKNQIVNTASQKTNELINQQLNNMVNTSSGTPTSSNMATSASNNSTDFITELQKPESIAAAAGLVLGTAITKTAAHQGWGLSALAGILLGAGAYYGTKELTKK